MKRKTNFLLYCIVGALLFSSACLLVYVRAADQSPSDCTSKLKDYFDKTDAFISARDAMVRANVAAAKAIPGSTIPPEWENFEEEYDSDPDGFFKKFKEGLGPKIPAIIGEIDKTTTYYTLRVALSEAITAYDSALAAQEEAEKELAACLGQSVVTIWCERGSDCQNTPGIEGNPYAHKVLSCPDKVEGLFNINVACPGAPWWSCDGKNKCPNSKNHVVRCFGDCGNMIGPDRKISYHLVYCKSCRQPYRKCSESQKRNHLIGSDGKCPETKKSNKHACGVHESWQGVSSDHSWGTFTCGDDTHTGYLCQQPSTHGAASCGTTGHYACDGSDHSSMSCPQENGKDCDYGSYYACSPHTHAYPEATPQSTCDAGHSYDPDNDRAVRIHRTRTCRFSGCSNTWQVCRTGWTSPKCNNTWRQSRDLHCGAQ